jgi:hypothetical protein
VIVVGAGPTGLTLAGELALAGVDCLVLERRPGLRTDSRAICLHARSMGMLDLRGLAETFARTGLPVPSFPLGLRGAAIRLRRLDSDFPYLLDLPQPEPPGAGLPGGPGVPGGRRSAHPFPGRGAGAERRAPGRDEPGLEARRRRHRRAPDWQLDTHQAERHPVGSAVLKLTGRQFRLNTAASLPGRAVRWLAQRAVAPVPFVQSRLAESYSGISIRYPAGAGAHQLAGTRLPRGQITLADGSIARMYELFRDGRFVLLDGDGPDDLPPQVSAVRYRACTVRLPPAMLVRPEGYVAWASGEGDPARRQPEVRRTAAHWCSRDDSQDPPGTAPGPGRM